MELFSDNFISYTDDFNVKLEKSSDHEISVASPSTRTCESTPNLYPSAFSPILQSLLNSQDLLTLSDNLEVKQTIKKRQPFTIIKTKRNQSIEHLEVKIESEEKILTKSKLIMKREKAKLRAKCKLESPIFAKIECKSSPEETVCDEPVEGKTKKKMVQMIRNRISAQNSRDRKKAYLVQLEEAKTKLYTDTMKVNQEKSMLTNEILKMKQANKRLAAENQELKLKNALGCVNCHQRNNNYSLEHQSLDEMIQNVISNTEPETANLLMKNESVFKNAFSFSLFLSSQILKKQIDQTQASNDESETTEDAFEGQNNLYKSVFEAFQKSEEYTDDNDNLTTQPSKFNTIYNHLKETFQSNRGFDMLIEDDDNDLHKLTKQEDQSAQFSQFFNSEKLNKGGMIHKNLLAAMGLDDF